MKRFFLPLFVIGCCFVQSHAQTASPPTFTQMPPAQSPAVKQEEPVDVPDTVVRNFVRDFTIVDHSEWKKSGNNLEAFFTENEADVRAVYSHNGTLIRTLRDVHSSILPSTAGAYIAKNYDGQTIDKVWQITEHDGSNHYEVTIDKNKLNFDGQGNIVKPKTTAKAKAGTGKTTQK